MTENGSMGVPLWQLWLFLEPFSAPHTFGFQISLALFSFLLLLFFFGGPFPPEGGTYMRYMFTPHLAVHTRTIEASSIK